KTSVRTQKYRLDHRGRLYDLTKDPGQWNDIAAEQPEIAAQLSLAVTQWQKDMLSESSATGSASVSRIGTGKASGTRDDRPFPVGYAEFPWTPLPARDGKP